MSELFTNKNNQVAGGTVQIYDNVAFHGGVEILGNNESMRKHKRPIVSVTTPQTYRDENAVMSWVDMLSHFHGTNCYSNGLLVYADGTGWYGTGANWTLSYSFAGQITNLTGAVWTCPDNGWYEWFCNGSLYYASGDVMTYAMVRATGSYTFTAGASSLRVPSGSTHLPFFQRAYVYATAGQFFYPQWVVTNNTGSPINVTLVNAQLSVRRMLAG